MLRHALLYAIGKIVPALCSLGTIALLARALGPDEFGRYALTSSMALFWANAGAVWIAQAVLRYQTRFERGPARASYASFVARARWIAAALAAVGAASVAAIARAGPAVSLGAAALAAAEATAVVSIAVTQARLRSVRVIAFESTRALLALGATAGALAVLGSRSAGAMVWAAALGVGASIVLFARRDPVPAAPDRPRARKLVRWTILRFGIPIAAFSLLSYALNVADRFLIAQWKGAASAGAYAAVYDVSYRVFGMLLFPVILSAHPLITEAWNKRDRAGARRALRLGLTLEVLVGVPLLVALGAAHGLVVRYALGTSVERSLELVVTIGLAALLWQLAQLIHKPSELAGRPLVLVAGAVIALGVNCAANVALLPRGPIVIAGYTTALASVCYIAFVWAVQRREAR